MDLLLCLIEQNNHKARTARGQAEEALADWEQIKTLYFSIPQKCRRNRVVEHMDISPAKLPQEFWAETQLCTSEATHSSDLTERLTGTISEKQTRGLMPSSSFPFRWIPLKKKKKKKKRNFVRGNGWADVSTKKRNKRREECRNQATREQIDWLYILDRAWGHLG